MVNLSQKDMASILYVYYLDNYCENDFNFDNGKFKTKINEHYNNLKNKLSDEDLEKIENQIRVIDKEGTNYDWLKITHPNMENLFLQVTSMIDYDGNKVNGYLGNSEWCDVGIFFVDYNAIEEFDDLEDNEIEENYVERED